MEESHKSTQYNIVFQNNRMNKVQFIVPILLGFISTLFAQKHMDSISIHRDFAIFENILKTAHPSLYTYCNEDSLNISFEYVKESLTDDLSDIGLYKKMLAITDRIKDGHLQLYAPKTIKTDQYYFPILLKIINAEFYTDVEKFEIPIGSKINKINDKKTNKILDDLKKYVPSDGYTLHRKYREIESKFGLYFAYEYGITKTYTIAYTAPDGTSKVIDVKAESFTEVNLQNPRRASYFSTYHSQKDDSDFFKNYITNKSPFLYYKKDLNTAVLVVNSFELDTQIFKTTLTAIFEELKKNKTQHLVIDIRRNNKGLRANAIQLYSFLSKTATFKQVTSSYVASLSIPERQYATHVFFNEREFLKDKFNNHPIYDGWQITFDDLEIMMRTHKNKFAGKVYVLIGGSTFSAGASFALSAKNDSDIILVGEETGSGNYFSNMGLPVYYQFPNSKIEMVMPMEKNNFYISEKTTSKGQGILPDKHILMHTDHLISGKDPELDYIFRLIKGSKLKIEEY